MTVVKLTAIAKSSVFFMLKRFRINLKLKIMIKRQFRIEVVKKFLHGAGTFYG